MQQTLGEVKNHVLCGQQSDSHAKHFATQFTVTIPPQTSNMNALPVGLSGKATPSAVKTFTTKMCALSAKIELQFGTIQIQSTTSHWL